ncbi:MAG: hypothetical protein A4E25_00104 [Methanobacterium sp. PtaB.Bin024]|jgi:hypothetical protein|nr:MAG: hypothetical protein A4E25_00104 [Methanobacterium sp. PtaB.Bin024]OPY25042.1 MAG: hypothetical protein A4E26_00020 [Methanobacterium sp. PtaU1.Bin097]
MRTDKKFEDMTVEEKDEIFLDLKADYLNKKEK